MKKHILLILCLAFSGLGYAQIQYNQVANLPGECNCYEFTVDQGNYPFYDQTQPATPGWDYFWIWGDGSHTFATSAITTHCYNGAIGINSVILELTPRKRPNEISKVYFNEDLNVDGPPCPTPSSTINGMNISLSSEPKVGKTFIATIQAKGCDSTTSFQFVYNEDNLELVKTYCHGNHAPLSSPFMFSAAAGEVVTHYLKFKVKEEAVEGTEITFLLQTSAAEVENEKSPNKDKSGQCENEFELPALITSGPYDPNILVPSHGKGMSKCVEAGDWITYNLQFKNEGRGATKDMVKVLIDLDSRLDKTTFEILNVRNQQNMAWPAGSSDMQFELETNNFSSWSNSFQKNGAISPDMVGVMCRKMELASIYGADSNSIGYVSFRVKVKQGVQMNPGDEIITRSQVYFDDEDPMPTNLAITSCGADSAKCCKPDCCCAKCAKPWYKKYGWYILGAFVLAVLFFFLRKRK